MNFFKDLNDEIENGTGELTSDDDQMVDTLSEDENFDEFDLSEVDSMDLDEEMLAKMELEESFSEADERKESSEKEEIFGEEEADVNEVAEETKEETKEVVSDSLEKEEGNEESVPFSFDDEVDSGKNTVISKGTIINGSIVSDGSLEVFGTVNGDITCLGKLSISGDVKGKSTASEVYINTNRLDGGIVSKGSVKIGVGTVVIGDVSATSCVIAGAVKGDLDVNGPVIIDSTAVVKGNINSKGIQINNGAIIDGFCALPYSTVDIDSFFGEEG